MHRSQNDINELDGDEGHQYPANAPDQKVLAQQRIGTEGQEGLRAFLERRQASFVKDLEREDPSV